MMFYWQRDRQQVVAFRGVGRLMRTANLRPVGAGLLTIKRVDTWRTLSESCNRSGWGLILKGRFLTVVNSRLLTS
jgi:hypothetical protein